MWSRNGSNGQGMRLPDCEGRKTEEEVLADLPRVMVVVKF